MYQLGYGKAQYRAVLEQRLWISLLLDYFARKEIVVPIVDGIDKRVDIADSQYRRGGNL